MTFFHAIQIAVAIAVVATVVERCRALCFRFALDAAPFRRAVVELVRRGELETARSLAMAGRPALVARAVWPLLDPATAPTDRAIELEDTLAALDDLAIARLRPLRVAASAASALGFIGAAIEIHWVFNGDHGLMRLQAGLVENLGLSRAVLSVAIGIATSSFALGSWHVLRKAAAQLVAEMRRAATTLEDAFAEVR